VLSCVPNICIRRFDFANTNLVLFLISLGHGLPFMLLSMTRDEANHPSVSDYGTSLGGEHKERSRKGHPLVSRSARLSHLACTDFALFPLLAWKLAAMPLNQIPSEKRITISYLGLPRVGAPRTTY
jgi:hypothetical protein